MKPKSKEDANLSKERFKAMKEGLLADYKLSKEERSFNRLKKTTFPLMGAVAISNILYTNLHAFYPLYLEVNFFD
jgi:hypothetical protein